MESPPTVASLLVSLLEGAGIRRMHALPGEENLEVTEALRTSGIDVIVARHEQHAAFAAATDGRLSGVPGACLATLGPGATNLFTGLAHANLGGFPLIAITGQKPALDNREGSFQVIDVVASARPLVKAALRLDDPLDTAPLVESALRIATEGRPGPVLIEVPEDVAGREVATTTLRMPPRPTGPAPSVALESAATVINRAQRPVMLVSEHGNRSAASLAITAFAEAAGIGVLTTQLGIGAIPHDHRLSIGALGIHRPDHSHLGLVDADLVLAVGYDPVEHPPLAWSRDDVEVIHVAPWPARVERGYRPSLDLVGDIGATLDALAPLVDQRSSEDAEARGAVVRSLLDDETQTVAASSDAAPTPLEIVAGLQNVLGDTDTVALDNGVYKIWFARHWRARHPQTLLLDNALATMGAGLAVGMAAAAQRPDHRTVAVCGDGGVLMNIQDLASAVHLGIDLTVLVLRDDNYGFIAWHQDEDALPRANVSLDNPDFVALAQAFGAAGARVSSRSELESGLRRSLERGGVHVIECPVDYSVNTLLDQGVEPAVERFRHRRHL